MWSATMMLAAGAHCCSDVHGSGLLDGGGGPGHAIQMSTVNGPEGTLTIELEDAATRRGWVSTLGLLAGTMQMWHFVGMLADEVRYESDTFSAPYSWGHLPLGRTMMPRNEWAPGMDKALDELRGEIAADGWVLVGRGEQEWQDRYGREVGE